MQRECDFLLLSEHWLSDDSIGAIKLRDFTIHNSFCRKNMKHGGVAIYVNDKCKYSVSCLEVGEFCEEGTFECAALALDELKLILIVVYRPPGGNFFRFLQLLDCVLNKSVKNSFSLIIAGDFNLNFIAPSFNLSLFHDLLCTYSLVSTITEPTRVAGCSSTCIDNILVSAALSYSSAVIDLKLSDHFAQLVKVNVVESLVSSKGLDNNKYVIKRNFCKNNIDTFVNCISLQNWDCVYAQDCPNEACNAFLRIVCTTFEESFPLSKQRVSISKGPSRSSVVLSSELRLLRDRVTMYHDLSKVDVKYKQALNECNKLYRDKLKIHVQNYYDKKIFSSDNKTKSMWRFINDVQKKVSGKNIEIFDDGVKLSDECLADMFNDHFSSAPSNRGDIDYMFLDSNTSFCRNTCFLSPVCKFDVLSLVNTLRNSNSAGFDGVSNKLIKNCKDYLCEVIAYLINLSFSKGIFPEALKLAVVIPLYKKGDRNNVSNYRAISLLSSISKIFELHLRNQMLQFLQSNKMLSASQHGFTLSKSTETALCEFQIKMIDALDRGLSVVGLFVDFSRAFDVIDHSILLAKLHRYGFRGNCHNLISSYLGHRCQYVNINNKKSKHTYLSMGVPQGSVIGPFLFLIFANDLFNFIERSAHGVSVTSYADDTNVLIVDKNSPELINKTEIIYNKILMWSMKNHLNLNLDKTNFVLFSNKTVSDKITIFADSENALTSISTSKMLGVTFDSRLLWYDHISGLCSRLRQTCFALKFMTNHFGLEVLKTLYFANFHSHLRYGILNWGLSAHVQRVFLLQKYAIRILMGLGPRQSCREIFKQHKILPLASIYIYEACVFVYKNKTMFEAYRGSHEHNTRGRNLLVPGSHRTALYQKNIFFNACKFYNILSDSIRASPNLYSFKSSIKRFLTGRAYYSIQEFL